ncbi:phage head closure protein [Nitratireductor mangrovi]|uniref:phage head closure protein n=1 Tax=Nitratireductor mangrovi TaxID=2599600 RepID=UPI001FEFCD63|nr:phage head closure protein [Nitratireductor mangrovi]
MSGLTIDPGALREALVLEALTPAQDDSGGQVGDWVEVGPVFAAIVPVGASGRAGAGQRLEKVTHRIIIRFRADIASGMRFRKGARVFLVTALHDPDETGRYLVCIVEEEGR